MLEAKNLSKSYGNLSVLKDIHLQIQSSEIVSIVGASGAGKSTLLQILGTLDTPDTGELFLNELAIHSKKEHELAQLRNEYMGFIFQFHNLLPELTAYENIALPAWIAKKSPEYIQEISNELLSLLGMSQRANHFPSQLSGGEQQRIAVARALVNQPKIVFADEPSGNLDSKNAESLHKLFFEIRNKYQCAFVIVTHNEQLANAADRKLSMQDGFLL